MHAFTMTDARLISTQFGERTVFTVITPDGELHALFLSRTVVRDKLVAHFADGGDAVGPCVMVRPGACWEFRDADAPQEDE